MTDENIEQKMPITEDVNTQDIKQEEQQTEVRGEAILDAVQNAQPLDRVDAVQNERIAELTADLQRTRADFENFRRQNDIQREQYANSAKFATVKKILPLVDDFERAIAAQPKELAPLAKNLEKTMKNLGLTRIESTPGTDFNPDLHNAISVDGDGDTEKISETLQSGYYYDGEVLREALVRVSKS